MNCKKLSARFLAASATIVSALAVACLGIGSGSPQAGATPLTLINDWKPAPQGTGDPAVQIFNGIVHFKGPLSRGFLPRVPKLRVAPGIPSPHGCLRTNGYVHCLQGVAFHQAQWDVIVTIRDDPETEYYLTSLDGASFAPECRGLSCAHTHPRPA